MQGLKISKARLWATPLPWHVSLLMQCRRALKRLNPQVYAGIFPISSDDYEDFRDALAKLSLNDASLFYEPESSAALGFGFRIGFPWHAAHGNHSRAFRA